MMEFRSLEVRDYCRIKEDGGHNILENDRGARVASCAHPTCTHTRISEAQHKLGRDTDSWIGDCKPGNRRSYPDYTNSSVQSPS
jgi:hypothetical protein